MIAQEAGPRRLHLISVVGTSLKSLPGALIGMIGAFSVLAQRNPALALLVALLMLLLVLVSAGVHWWRFTYEVREREIVIAHGLLSRQRRVIPFDRVRDIAIERPLIARLVGTAKVRIETGGGKSDEGMLDMIELDIAQSLRNRIRQANVAAPAGPASGEIVAPETAEPPEPVLFAMPLERVLGSGLLNFSLVFIALAFGALQYLEDLGIIDFERLARSGGATRFAGMFTLRTGLFLLLLLILLGTLSGVLRTLARDYNFRLTVSPAGLRRRRGLFTVTEVLIPARRTEAARLDRGWLSGWLGWESLAFQTLGADPKEGGVQVAAPFARPEEVARILDAAGFPQPPKRPLIRPPALALVRRCGPLLLLAMLLVGAAQLWPPAWWGVPVPIAIAGLGVLHWRRDGHLLGDDALFVSGGIFRRRLWIIPYEKLQTLATSHGPWQRQLGLASLAPDTAGANAFGAPDIEDLPRRDAEALAGQLLARFYEARARVRQSAGSRH